MLIQVVVKFCRALDAHALIGNLGGYIGLLLGFSVLQLPELLLHLGKTLTKRPFTIINN